MDDLLKAMRDSGFKPKLNEDFPAIKGEYSVSIKSLKPWVNKDTGDKEAYVLEFVVEDTLSGDPAKGRFLSKWYRIAGTKFAPGQQGVSIPLEPADVIEAIKALQNDIFTLDGAPSLNVSYTAESWLLFLTEMEASFGPIIGATGTVKAWHYESRTGKIKQDLKVVQKKSTKPSGVKSESVPF